MPIHRCLSCCCLVAALLLSQRGTAAESAAVRIVAHRGLLHHAPENTLAGFRACLELRTGFEVDVRRTKDGHLVCVHDETLDRTTSGTGKVADLTLAELRALDAGSWFDPAFRAERVPTLEEVLQTLAQYPQDVLVAMDLKDADVEADVVQAASRHRVLGKLLFIGRTISMPGVRQQVRKAHATAHIAVLANTADDLAEALSDPDANWVYVRYVPSEEEVAQAHQNGRRVFLSGPAVAGREVENWRRAAGNGVDAILTDFPLELAATLREAGRSD